MSVLKIYISNESKYYSGKKSGAGINLFAKTLEKESIECHEAKGIVGDRYYDYKEDFKGQITFISHDLHLKMQNELGIKIDMTDYRRNVFLDGIDPHDLIAKVFKIGSCEFIGIEDCAPCAFMDKYIAKGAKNWMKDNNLGGLRAKILKSGILSVGDEVRTNED